MTLVKGLCEEGELIEINGKEYIRCNSCYGGELQIINGQKINVCDMCKVR